MKRSREISVNEFFTDSVDNVVSAVDFYLRNYHGGDGENRCEIVDGIVTKCAVYCFCSKCKLTHEQTVEVDTYAPIMDIYCIYDQGVPTKRVGHNFHVFRDYVSSDLGLARVFVEGQHNNIVVSNEANFDGYVWDSSTALWLPKSKKFMEPIVSSYLQPILEAILGYTLGRGLQPKQKGFTPYEGWGGIDHGGEFVSMILATLKYVQSTRGIRSIFAQAAPYLYKEQYRMKLNIIPYLFPVTNRRVVDLRTGITRTRTREDMFSFERPVELVDGPHTIVEDFFKQIMLKVEYDSNQNIINSETCIDTVRYMQRFCGYKLTGEMSERKFTVCHGEGSNAKGTIALIDGKIMGLFYVQASKDVFIKAGKKSAGACTPHIIPLIGARYANTAETDENDELNEGFLKGASHGDVQTVRGLYKEQFTYIPQFKLAMETNVKPKFTFEDQAMHDSIVLIPFNARFVDNPTKPNEIKRNPEYAASLLTDENINHFFSWYVKGAVEWYNGHKLKPTGIIEAATKAYVNECDHIASFITQCCEVGEHFKQTQLTVYQHYVNVYCRPDQTTPLGRQKFYKALLNKGFAKVKNGCMYITGLQIKE
jgi:P4 family phage/plasmid primase-like protien